MELGNNRNGQLSNGSAANSNLEVPHKMVFPDAIIAVSGGDSHTLAVDMNGQVWAWGSNEKGQLGTERKKQENLPIKIMISLK
jgi:alpha-tubulin suppressor-like RCC1 family protein